MASHLWKRFCDDLPVKHRVKVLDALSLLEEYGNALREPCTKSMDYGFIELRVRFSGDNMRVFYY